MPGFAGQTHTPEPFLVSHKSPVAAQSADCCQMLQAPTWAQTSLMFSEQIVEPGVEHPVPTVTPAAGHAQAVAPTGQVWSVEGQVTGFW